VQSEQALLAADPEPEKFAPMIRALAEPEYVLPPAVADRLTPTVPAVKSPIKDAEISVPDAAEPFAKVGLVAPPGIRL
jgi:hypothetical protein